MGYDCHLNAITAYIFKWWFQNVNYNASIKNSCYLGLAYMTLNWGDSLCYWSYNKYNLNIRHTVICHPKVVLKQIWLYKFGSKTNNLVYIFCFILLFFFPHNLYTLWAFINIKLAGQIVRWILHIQSSMGST